MSNFPTFLIRSQLHYAMIASDGDLKGVIAAQQSFTMQSEEAARAAIMGLRRNLIPVNMQDAITPTFYDTDEGQTLGEWLERVRAIAAKL